MVPSNKSTIFTVLIVCILAIVISLLAINFVNNRDLNGPYNEFKQGFHVIVANSIEKLLLKEDPSVVEFKIVDYKIVNKYKSTVPTKETYDVSGVQPPVQVPLSDDVIVYDYAATIEMKKRVVAKNEVTTSKREITGKVAFRKIQWKNIRDNNNTWWNCQVP
jgi:hypothetical protein